MLERDVENPAKSYAKRRGWWVRKFKSLPGNKAEPDDVFLKDGLVFWCEFKRPGKEPTDLQYEKLRDIIAHGGDAIWVNDLEDFKAALHEREAVLAAQS